MRRAPSPPPPYSLSPRVKPLFPHLGIAVDALLENRRRLEHHHPARRNRYFLAGLGVTPDPLALLAHHERTERRQFPRLATLEAVGDFLQNQLDERGRFGARQSYLLVDCLAQIR